MYFIIQISGKHREINETSEINSNLKCVKSMTFFSEIERKVHCRFLINQITVLIKVDKIEEEEVSFKN